jgi:hypothetical protein
MVFRIAASLVCATLWGCAPDETSTKLSAQFGGRWVGQYSVEGEPGTFHYVIERKKDGTYVLERKQIDSGKILFQGSEAGKWFVEDGAYKIKTEKVDGKQADARDMSNYQAYAIERVAVDSIALKHALSNTQISEKRVPTDFKLP